jgi:mannitol-1-phosphate 5-dehydrogenase
MTAGRAVIVGPGRIGSGFLAERMRDAGLDVTMVTRTAERAQALNRDGGVRVRLLTRSGDLDTFVGPLEAVPAEDASTVARRIAEASVVAVSVGSANLSDVVPIITPGLSERREPVDVLVVENQADAGSRLRDLVAASAPGTAARHGFASVLVDRIVTAHDDGAGGPVRYVAEARIAAAVEGRSLRARLPRIAGLRPVAGYDAHVQRKLYVFSAGHAATAYLGALHGHHDLPVAAEDPEVRAGVLAAVAEGQAGLDARYGRGFSGGAGRRSADLDRYRNAALGDTVDRVGRDPLRKLRAEDRILGPALLAAGAGTAPVSLAVGAAAALRFGRRLVAAEAQRGSHALALARQLREDGVPAVLERHAGVPAADPVAQLVSRAWSLLGEARSITWTRAALAAELDRIPGSPWAPDVGAQIDEPVPSPDNPVLKEMAS